MGNQFHRIRDINKKDIIILCLCFMIGLVLRFHTFDKRSLWIDEVHTFNDSRYGFSEQINFYKENPTFLHPPLFYLLSHFFYPFHFPERDLRIIPLIFGILAIPMFYLLAKQFSTGIGLPCALSLTFMTYHIYFSQEARSYSLSMFLGMAGLYFLMRHLNTSKRSNLLVASLFFAVLFHTNYSGIPFIILSQLLWFYRLRENDKRPEISSFIILNGLILLFCLPWILFIALNYHGNLLMDPLHTETPGALRPILSGMLQDWAPHPPLSILSLSLLISFPFVKKPVRNSVILLAILCLPVIGVLSFCRLFHITHFLSSKYFINSLPVFLITLFLSVEAIETKFVFLKSMRFPTALFLVIFILSNIIMYPLYYRSEKQDFRGLDSYLKGHIQSGDKIFVAMKPYLPGVLHYWGVIPQGRSYVIQYKEYPNGYEHRIDLNYQGKLFTIYNSNSCCMQYVSSKGRIWIIVDKWASLNILDKNSPFVKIGVFDGRISFFRKFPVDGSMVLYSWDPGVHD